MRKFIATTFALCLCIIANAQFIVSPYMPSSNEGLSANNAGLIKSRLGSIINQNGLISAEGGRFILTMNWHVVDKEIVGSGPTVIMYRLEVALALGDGMTGTKYASTVFTLKGAGNNEAKAVVNALKGMKAHNAEISKMITEGTKRIVAYYEKNRQKILAEARSQMNQGNYADALFTLAQIPMEVSYFSEVQRMMGPCYRKLVNQDAARQLQKAKALWAASPSQENAYAVMAIAGEIDPSSNSYSGAQSLIADVKKRVKFLDDQDRADILREEAYEHELEMAQLQAYRDIAIEEARNQPTEIYNTTTISTWWTFWLF